MDIERELAALADPAYREFQAKLVPTVDPCLVLGVRTPALRRFARDLVRKHPDEARAFIAEPRHRLYEEMNLHGELIGLMAKTSEEAFGMLDAFLPHVDNWATCDLIRVPAFKRDLPAVLEKIRAWCSCGAADEARKPSGAGGTDGVIGPDKPIGSSGVVGLGKPSGLSGAGEPAWQNGSDGVIGPARQNGSGRTSGGDPETEYVVRFGVVQLTALFLDDAFDPSHLDIVAGIERPEYYINMARAWYFSFALIKQPEATLPLFERRPISIDAWTHNRSLQKARESRRATPEQKAYLQSLKVRV